MNLEGMVSTILTSLHANLLITSAVHAQQRWKGTHN
jgi:hypothetical protein